MSVPSGSSSCLCLRFHLHLFFCGKLEEGNAQTGNNNQQQTSTRRGEFETSMNCHDNVFIIYEPAWVCVCVCLWASVSVANKRILLMNTRHHVRPRNVRVSIVRKAGKTSQALPLLFQVQVTRLPPFSEFPSQRVVSYQEGRQKCSINLSVYEMRTKNGVLANKKKCRKSRKTLAVMRIQVPTSRRDKSENTLRKIRWISGRDLPGRILKLQNTSIKIDNEIVLRHF